MRKQIEEQQRRIREALLAELATKKTQIMVANEIRRKYIVKNGDTLESIAQAQLRDVNLSSLIYQVNKLTIKVSVENGKRIPQLKTGMVLYLPNITDIAIFRSSVNNARKSGSGIAAGVPSKTSLLDDARREALERLLGKLGENTDSSPRPRTYTVRLGDTLTAIATRHPALQDASLWKLVARLNNLSVDTDVNGMPLATLRRGSTLVLPTVQQIDDFKSEQTQQSRPAQMVAC
jgi:LysM repeat protein